MVLVMFAEAIAVTIRQIKECEKVGEVQVGRGGLVVLLEGQAVLQERQPLALVSSEQIHQALKELAHAQPKQHRTRHHLV